MRELGCVLGGAVAGGLVSGGLVAGGDVTRGSVVVVVSTELFERASSEVDEVTETETVVSGVFAHPPPKSSIIAPTAVVIERAMGWGAFT